MTSRGGTQTELACYKGLAQGSSEGKYCALYWASFVECSVVMYERGHVLSRFWATAVLPYRPNTETYSRSFNLPFQHDGRRY